MTLEKIGQILERLERKVNAHDSKFDRIEKRLDQSDKKLDDFREEQLRQSIMLEQLENDFKTLGEAVVDTIKLKTRADNQDERIERLEGDNKLTKSVLAIHSNKLKTLET